MADSIYAYFKQAAAASPAQTFVKNDQGIAYTYQQFLERTIQLAETWTQQGIGKGSFALISELDPLLTLELLFAAWSLDCTVCLVSPASFPYVQAYISAHAHPSIIATNGEINLSLVNPESEQSVKSANEPEIIVFTSGTAAAPKGVIHTHLSLMENARSILQYIPLDTTDNILIVKSLYHIAALSGQVIPALLSGSTLVLPTPGKSPKALAHYILTANITYIDTVATLWRYLALAFAAANEQPVRLRFLSINGEHVAPAELIKFQQSLPEAMIFYAYGQTEAGPRVTFLPPGSIAVKSNSVGMPINGTKLRIKAGTEPYELFIEKLSADTVIGEVLVQSPSIMKGYWNNDALTREKLQNGWLHSGDIGYLDAEGYLYIVGRYNDRIIRGGQTIYPQEIEDVILTIPWVKECCIAGEPDPMHGQKIVAYIAPAHAESASRVAVFQQLRARLPSYMIPQEILFCDELPKSSTGKMSRVNGYTVL